MDYSSFSFSFGIGNNIAADDISTVNMIVLVPLDIPERYGNVANIKLAIKLNITKKNIILFFLAGGIIIAINIPYNATLSALNISVDRIFPAAIPAAVPVAHPGIAIATAP